MATSAPSRAKKNATARPIPESPPVTSAALPSSFPAALYAEPFVARTRIDLRLDAGMGLMLFG